MERIVFTAYSSYTKQILYGDNNRREWGNKRKRDEKVDTKTAKKFQTIEIRFQSPSEIATSLVSFFDKYETITQEELIKKLKILCETWEDRARLKLEVKSDLNFDDKQPCVLTGPMDEYEWDYFRLVYSIKLK